MITPLSIGGDVPGVLEEVQQRPPRPWGHRGWNAPADGRDAWAWGRSRVERSGYLKKYHIRETVRRWPNGRPPPGGSGSRSRSSRLAGVTRRVGGPAPTRRLGLDATRSCSTRQRLTHKSG